MRIEPQGFPEPRVCIEIRVAKFEPCKVGAPCFESLPYGRILAVSPSQPAGFLEQLVGSEWRRRSPSRRQGT